MIKFVKKSLTPGYSAEEVNEVLNEYLDEFPVDAGTLAMLYELMPTELFDGIRTTLEDEFGWF